MTNKSAAINSLLSYFDDNREAILEDLFTFLRFQSISTLPDYQPEMEKCSTWLADYFAKIGMDVEIWRGAGHPIVFASWDKAGPDKPTVLIYGHYDVQPVDPLELWHSPPFSPEIRDGEIYARGAQDNKGQCFFTIAAIKALLETNGELPVNVKFCIEGEEECGSPLLSRTASQYAEKLHADYFLVVDMSFHRTDVPSITLGLRGITTLTLEFVGANTDLHSGGHGGIVYNVNHALVEVLAKLRDQSGRVAVPGFYDDVMELSAEEKSCLDLEFDSAQYQQMFGAEANGGECQYSPFERAWLRPTLEINGIAGGYAGEGFKTVIPARAQAKISCRLVPNQNPQLIQQLVSSYIASCAPEGIEVKIEPGHFGDCIHTHPKDTVVQAAAQAFSEVCHSSCQYCLTGGSVPVAAAVAKAAGAETALIGFGMPEDNMHAPNEHFGVDRVGKGMAVTGRILELLALGESRKAKISA